MWKDDWKKKRRRRKRRKGRRRKTGDGNETDGHREIWKGREREEGERKKG